MYDLTGFRATSSPSQRVSKNHTASPSKTSRDYYEGDHHGRLYPNLDTLVEKDW